MSTTTSESAPSATYHQPPSTQHILQYPLHPDDTHSGGLVPGYRHVERFGADEEYQDEAEVELDEAQDGLDDDEENSDSDSEDEDEFYVTLDLSSVDQMLISRSAGYRLIVRKCVMQSLPLLPPTQIKSESASHTIQYAQALDTSTPFLQLSGTVMKGQIQTRLGTDLVFRPESGAESGAGEREELESGAGAGSGTLSPSLPSFLLLVDNTYGLRLTAHGSRVDTTHTHTRAPNPDPNLRFHALTSRAIEFREVQLVPKGTGTGAGAGASSSASSAIEIEIDSEKTATATESEATGTAAAPVKKSKGGKPKKAPSARIAGVGVGVGRREEAVVRMRTRTQTQTQEQAAATATEQMELESEHPAGGVC